MKTLFYAALLVAVFLLAAITGCSQEVKKNGDVWNIVEERPEFIGGNDALMKYVSDNVQYPEKAKQDSFTGKVYVSFIIDEQGKVTKPKIFRSAHPILDKEALRVVAEMPDWIPGKEKGKAVKVTFNIPIQFAMH